jgi:hypothetical protein
MSFSSLPIRVRHALEQANIKTPEELAQKSRGDLQRAKNIGPKTIAVLEAYLAGRGLALLPENTLAAGGPAPEWLLTYERRAKDAGFRTERCDRSIGGFWLSVVPGGDEFYGTISLFGPSDFILNARIHNQNPSELIASATVLVDSLAVIAPEAVETRAAA